MDHPAHATYEAAHKCYAKGCRQASCKEGHKLYMREYRRSQGLEQQALSLVDGSPEPSGRSTDLPARSTGNLETGTELRHPAQPRVGKMHRNAKPTERAAAAKQLSVIGEKTKRLLEAFAEAGDRGLIRWEAVEKADMLLSSVCSCLDSLVEGGWVRGSGKSRVAHQTNSPGEIFYITGRGRRWVNRKAEVAS